MLTNKKTLDVEAGELDGTQGGDKTTKTYYLVPPFLSTSQLVLISCYCRGPYVLGDKGGGE